MLIFYDFIQVFVFTTNHHLNVISNTWNIGREIARAKQHNQIGQ